MTPAATRRLTWLAVAGVAALGVWGGLRWRAAAARQAQIEGVGYYRVRAAYTVKDTGERVEFDYVAACAVAVTMYRDGDRSVDTPFGVAPKTVIAPTRDGHAIQVVTPRACHGEVEEGWIPPDLIPLTIFYEDVRDLHFGWGYTSQDAYDNARSRMNFEGATVTAATWTDFMAWREKAAAGFKPVGQVRSPWGYSYENGTGVTVASSCAFYLRTPVSASGKPALTAEWEKRGRPEFWITGDGMHDPEFWDSYRIQQVTAFHVHPRTRDGGVGTIGLYSNQRWGKEHYHQDRVYPVNEVYPYLPISLASTPPPTLESRVFPTEVPVSDDWKGLAACGKNDPSIDDLARTGFFKAAPQGGRYPGEENGTRTRPFLANNTVVTLVPWNKLRPPRLFFQRDESLLTDESNVIEGIMP